MASPRQLPFGISDAEGIKEREKGRNQKAKGVDVHFPGDITKDMGDTILGGSRL